MTGQDKTVLNGLACEKNTLSDIEPAVTASAGQTIRNIVKARDHGVFPVVISFPSNKLPIGHINLRLNLIHTVAGCKHEVI